MPDLLRPTPIENELLRPNRYEVIIPTDVGLLSWMVQTCDRPTYTVNIVDLPYLNTKFYLAGQYSWESIDMELICPIGPSTTQKTSQLINLQSESLSGRQGYAKGYVKNITLHSLDPNGAPVEEWILVNAMVKSVKFGKFDSGDDSVQKVSITWQPQYCIQSF